MSDFSEQIKSIDERTAKLAIEKELTLQKALNSGSVDDIYKAQSYYTERISRMNKTSGYNSKGKSMIIDPFESTSMGYYDKPYKISYATLRAMSKTPIIKAIIFTRKDQVAEFAQPQPDKYSKGFVIKRKTTYFGDDKDKQLTTKDKKEIEEITKFLLNGGDEDQKWRFDNFEVFIRKLIEDSLSLDQGCFEIVPTRIGVPTQFYAVDAATFRLADSYDDQSHIEDTPKINGYYPSYVQVYEGQVINEYYPWELCFGIRNPQTDIYSNGYGRSELEDLIQTVTAMLNADSYNSKFFRNGTAPKGMLVYKGQNGNVNRDRISELRREWNSMMSGVENHHKTPIIPQDMEWVDMQKSNRDMEFGKYQEYLIKLACAIYKISPEEVGFPIEGTDHSSLGRGSKEGEKKYSQNKGLKPLLRTLQFWINKYIVGPKTNDQYEFQFTGIDLETETEEEERLNKAVTTYMEVNELRKIKGMEEKEGYDVILNPVILQSKQMEMMGDPQSDQFMQEEEDNENPFLKSFNNWWDREMIVN